jgi:hypothetical protein
MRIHEIKLSNGGLLQMGWDPKMGTYFATVLRPVATDACTQGCYARPHTYLECRGWAMTWLAEGESANALPTLSDLKRALVSYSEDITDELEALLVQDRIGINA